MSDMCPILSLFQVFHDTLLDLRRVVLSSYILNDNICDPFFVLSEPCEYRVDGGNCRPICFLVSGCMWECIGVIVSVCKNDMLCVYMCECVCVSVCVCVCVCVTRLSHFIDSHVNELN